MKKLFWIFILGLFVFQNTSFLYAETILDDTYEKLDEFTNTDNNTTNNNSNTSNNTNTSNNANPAIGSPMGITMDKTCLLNWQCKFNIYQFLGIKTSVADASSPELFVQDILLSATFFIGTVVTITFIVSGLMFIFAWATGKDPTKAKAGIKNSLIGLLIVVCSYSIIRIVQYIAKGL